jgi:hypothetical protein
MTDRGSAGPSGRQPKVIDITARLVGMRPADSEDSLVLRDQLRRWAEALRVDYDALPEEVRLVFWYGFLARGEVDRVFAAELA